MFMRSLGPLEPCDEARDPSCRGPCRCGGNSRASERHLGCDSQPSLPRRARLLEYSGLRTAEAMVPGDSHVVMLRVWQFSC